MPPTPVPHPLVGKTLGNYVLRQLIGQGGVGYVFAGEHRFLGDKVAIKLLQGSFGHDSDLGRRFFQEARTTRAIDHPNVVKILDFGQEEHQTGSETQTILYLVMELVEGRSLAAMLKKGPLVESETCNIGAAIADGLQAAHAIGVIHRDLKPGNIMINSAGQAKILDFGLAKLLENASQTATGVVLGTPQYMAPEQAKQAKLIGPKTDIYALGVVLFRMCTGRLPFQAEGMAEMISAHLYTKPPKPSECGKVSPDMEELILHCLEKDPARRPASMADVRNRLRRILATSFVGALSDAPRMTPAPMPVAVAEAAGPAPVEAPPQNLVPAGMQVRTLVDAPAPVVAAVSTLVDADMPAGGLDLISSTGSPMPGSAAISISGGTTPSLGAPTPTPGADRTIVDTQVPDFIAQLAAAPASHKEEHVSDSIGGGAGEVMPHKETSRSIMSRSSRLALVAFTVLALAGAAVGGWLILHPRHAPPATVTAVTAPVEVALESEPAGAEVLVDGKLLGKTPTRVRVALPHDVEFRLDGVTTKRHIDSAAPGKIQLK